MSFPMLEITKQSKISTFLLYGLGQKRPRFVGYPLFGLLLCVTYI